MTSLAVLVLWAPLAAKADDWNKETVMTFNKPIEVPGMVLGPGSYDFRLLDSVSDRNVVQILNADGSHLYENVLAIPAYRAQASDKTVVTFEERAQGSPQAIATWFFPGDNYGEEFVYSKARTAGSTAMVTGTHGTTAAAQPASKPAYTAQTGNTLTRQAQSAAPPVTKQKPVQIAQAAAQPKVAQASTATAAPPQKQAAKRLPKTASPLPLLFMLGLFSLGGAAGIHVFSKRSI
jgi:hypothetical protein